MIRGPVEYVAPVEVEVVTKRTAIPLDENEGKACNDKTSLLVLVVVIPQEGLAGNSKYRHFVKSF